MIKVLIFKKEGCPPCKQLVDSIDYSDEELDGVDLDVIQVENHLDTAILYNVRSTPTTVVKNENERIIYSGTMVKDFKRLKELIVEAKNDTRPK